MCCGGVTGMSRKPDEGVTGVLQESKCEKHMLQRYCLLQCAQAVLGINIRPGHTRDHQHYKSLTRVSQECYKSITRVLQAYYKHITSTLQECYKHITNILREGCKSVTSILQTYYKSVARVLQAYYKSDSHVLEGAQALFEVDVRRGYAGDHERCTVAA
jgi:hypothetical protein